MHSYPPPDPQMVEKAQLAAKENRGCTIDEILETIPPDPITVEKAMKDYKEGRYCTIDDILKQLDDKDHKLTTEL